jgi:hypothetical protein
MDGVVKKHRERDVFVDIPEKTDCHYFISARVCFDDRIGVPIRRADGNYLGFYSKHIGATAAFIIGLTVARAWVDQKISGNPKFVAMDKAVGEEGAKIIFLTCLSSIFPFNLLNYTFGLTQVSFRHCFFGSWPGYCQGP